MPLESVELFPPVTAILTTDVMLNFMKSVDIRLLEEIPDVDTHISTRYECEIFIDYIYHDHKISVCIAATYVIVRGENGAIMMYEGDGEELSVKERLFSAVMSILNDLRCNCI